MTGGQFEDIVRNALRLRDDQRRARLLDQSNYDAADARFVSTVLEAAGFAVPEPPPAVVKARRTRAKKNEDAAFPEAG